MPLGSESVRVVIAGAASLRGKDLRQWIEESGFPAGQVCLVDDELAVGTLTEVAGEPAVIQPVDESTFDAARFVFFTGSASFAARHGAAAQRAGATVIDLTGGLAAAAGARPWIPPLDVVLGRPGKSGAIDLCISPSAPAIVASSFAAGLRDFSPVRLSIVFFQPVSERGQAGVDELEAQTAKLLSFQPMPEQVFDTQVAFNMLDRWGPASAEHLTDLRSAIRREILGYLAGRLPAPAVTLVHAPVFYGHAFTAYAEFAAPCDPARFVAPLEVVGFKTLPTGDPAASNVAVAGEPQPIVGPAENDTNVDRGYWFWGAADNIRLTAANATRIAGALLAS